MTMVYGDHFFLRRWYEYYRAQIGAENLFVLSHGNDPEHHAIACEANVIGIPRDPSMQGFDVRRWQMMGLFASGLLSYYDRMIVADVDEIVIVDPAAAPGLVAYLARIFPDPLAAPPNVAPLGLELVHIPAEEPLPIVDGQTILSRRRTFRPNRNYSKPCVIGGLTVFSAGGHTNNLGLRFMPDDMYLIHLKYFDNRTVSARAWQRRRIVEEAARLRPGVRIQGWHRIIRTYREMVANARIAGEDVELAAYRAAMKRQVEKGPNRYVWGPAQDDALYRLPERFGTVF
jgi:hypothetical protein